MPYRRAGRWSIAVRAAMSALIPAPDARPPAAPPDPARTLDLLATTILVVLVIAILYLAREILVPVAIAILLSFVLAPLVKALRKLGIGKRIAVGIVVLSAFLVAVGLGAILAKQISDLAADAPKYQATVAAKVRGLQNFAANNPVLHKLDATIADVAKMSPSGQGDKPKPRLFPTPKPADEGELKASDQPGGKAPIPVEVVEPAPGVLTILQAAVGTAASPLATAAFVAIFIVFILMQREDLRNRFIRLVGFGDLQRTTLAMNDAARRLSRYFLAQVLLNTGFGAIVAAALAIIGVPSAILWGIVATFMRFIPYIGSLGAAIFPMTMAAAAGEGWTMVVETAVVFVILEAIVGQAIEPLVYGHNTGISPIAVVASATFWTWLWGPVGLVLATPLTVILVVMGRHVERLSFLDVLLGDAPPLTLVETFYQRMLAGDPSEIADHADEYLRQHTMLDYCEQVAMRALLLAQIDVRRGVLEEQRQGRIRDAMRDLVDDLAEQEPDKLEDVIGPASNEALASLEDKVRQDPAPPIRPAATIDKTTSDKTTIDKTTTKTTIDKTTIDKTTIDKTWRRPKSVVCFAGRTPLDEAAARLLADLLGRRGIGAHVEPAESLMATEITDLAGAEIKLVILSLLDADLKISQARFAVRRLRRRVPGVPIVSAFWMPETDAARATGLCGDVRCDSCVSSLTEAIDVCLKRAGCETMVEAAATAA